MIIDTLIWSKVTVTYEDKSTFQLRHVSTTFKANGLLFIREHTSSQGISIGEASWTYPELVSLSPSSMTLKAYTWTDKSAKDKEVSLVFEF